MKRYRLVIETGYAGANYEGIAEFENDEEVTEENLERALDQFVHDRIESYWEEIGDDEN